MLKKLNNKTTRGRFRYSLLKDVPFHSYHVSYWKVKRPYLIPEPSPSTADKHIMLFPKPLNSHYPNKNATWPYKIAKPVFIIKTKVVKEVLELVANSRKSPFWVVKYETIVFFLPPPFFNANIENWQISRMILAS
jgi:hypothetical protein